MFKAFETARKSAPSILFVDEIDSFTDREDDNGHNGSYVRQVINAFLECLDGTVDREGVVVIGACNNPAVIDPAILRSGRLDNHVRLPLPDAEAPDLDGATRLAIILDRHLGMNGLLNAWPAGVAEKLIDSARRFESQLLKRIEPVLHEQLARAKTIVESYRTPMEGLWLELIGAGHLTGRQIVDGLKPDNDVKDMPTPKRRLKGRQRLHG